MNNGNEYLILTQAIKSAFKNSDEITSAEVSSIVEIDNTTNYSSIFGSKFGNFIFKNCSLFGRILETSFVDCKFVNCIFTCNIKDSKFLNCKFINCTFNGVMAYDEDDICPDNQMLAISGCDFDDTILSRCTFISYRLINKDKNSIDIFKCKDLMHINFIDCALPTYDELYLKNSFNGRAGLGKELNHYYFFFHSKIIISPYSMIKLDDYLECGKEYTKDTLPLNLTHRVLPTGYSTLPSEFIDRLCKLIKVMNKVQVDEVLKVIGSKP